MAVEIRLLGREDRLALDRLAPGVFDRPIDPRWSAEFLADPRHHLAVALDDGVVVGMASAVNYVNPDKPPALWINEVGVAPTHRRRGVGRGLLQALLARGRALGCGQAWVLTDASNTAARRLYAGSGGRAAAERCRMFEFRLDQPGTADQGADRGWLRPAGRGDHVRRSWTIIGVKDVAASCRWYQTLLGLREAPPVHDHFGQILDADGTVLLCLHRWGAHEHPTLTSPDQAPPGNGLLLFFRVDDYSGALQRARGLVARFEEEPHLNPNTGTMELSVRDPDGYWVTISALSSR
jgi:GNAT superfamily N-acetyltransferase/catechol 2,3-dioxygenase-like lactoylglutathione lyase family enzyme